MRRTVSVFRIFETAGRALKRRLGLTWVGSLGGGLLAQHATVRDGRSLDGLPPFQDGRPAPEVYV